VCVIANVWGRTIDEYVQVASHLEGVEGVHGLEVNVSCPNIKKGGIAFGTDPDMLKDVVAKVRGEVSLPLIVKLSPNVTDIAVFASICEQEGADAVSLINSIPAMVIDVESRKPALSNVIGGLSGPAIHPVATRLVWQAAGAVDIPVVGLGGIADAEDAIEFILAGATAVGIGTANLADPQVAVTVTRGIEAYMLKHGFRSIPELSGAVEV
jgi:dihydroorotate dehydrogenase (NAD+) catalytic subunit